MNTEKQQEQAGEILAMVTELVRQKTAWIREDGK